MKKFLLIALSCLLAITMCSCCCVSFVEGIMDGLGLGEDENANNMFSDGMLCVKYNGKYGYVDVEGEFVIEAQYDNAMPFKNGTALVQIGEYIYLIDTEGTVIETYDEDDGVYPPQYYTILASLLYGEEIAFSEDLYLYKTANGKFGYKNAEGDRVIAAQFDQALPFQEDVGLAVVMCDGKYGYINESGDFVVEPIYKNAGLFYNGFAIIDGDEGRAFIDTEGNVVSHWYEDVESFSNGLAAVKTDGQWGYINEEGKWAIQPQFSGAESFTEDGAAMVLFDGKYGFIDTTGKYIVSPKYDQANNFSEGYAAVCSDGSWSFITLSGEKLTSYKFDRVGDFKNGAAWVEEDDEYGFINTSGRYIVSPQFKDVGEFGKNGLAPVLTDDNKYGYINLSGEGVIQPIYDAEESYYYGYRLPAQSNFYDDGYAVGYKDGKCGVIDKDGVYVIGPRFESIVTWDDYR